MHFNTLTKVTNNEKCFSHLLTIFLFVFLSNERKQICSNTGLTLDDWWEVRKEPAELTQDK